MNDDSRPANVSQSPPEASPRAVHVARRIVSPVESFLRIEAASGVLLLVTAIVAMIAANSRFAGAYHALLELPIGGRIGSLAFEAPLQFWVNDGLMAIFFFVVGLEIRREIAHGELSTPRRAALPIAAALGGMAVPALLYLAVAGSHPELRSGWAVPMATDIAFAVGVLALLGKRVPPAMRILLLALAIIDDIGGIIVIALFYSESLQPLGFALAAVGFAGIFLLQRIGVRRALVYVPAGFVAWLGILKSGVHPTVAGVAIGLITPARAWFGPTGLADAAKSSADFFDRLFAAEGEDLSPERLHEHGANLDRARREAIAPVERLQFLLHPWVAFIIMPVFAFANAGVTIDTSVAFPSTVGLAIGAGLVLGKPIGIAGACLIAARVGIATLPRGIGARQLIVLGVVAGVGFTIALFISSLAFESATLLSEAKAAVLAASTLAIVLAIVIGNLLLRKPDPGAAKTATEAESSDEL